MATAKDQIQTNITNTQKIVTNLTAQVNDLNKILSTGTPGVDSQGGQTRTVDTYDNNKNLISSTTYSVANLNNDIADYTAQIATYGNIIIGYQNQLPLASSQIYTSKDTPPQGTGAKIVLKNYRHASRIFVDSQFRLSPKYGFLFYVEFDFNPLISNVSNISAQELGMIVKNVSLPKFSIDTKVHNAYNRVNIVQNKIKYDPVNITFHDDQADNVRNFWYDYYSYFYRDSDYADASYGIIHKYQERPSFEWGYTPKPVGSYNATNAYQNYQYIQAIRIYSLYQNNFSEYELINPIITNFRHGDHANGDNQGILEHQMTVQFETVKYQTGYTTKNTVGGYIDLHYDNVGTPNHYPGGSSPAADTANQTVTDLASFNLTANGGAVVPNFIGILNSVATAKSTMATATGASAGVAANAGGFILPALGSLTTGISNSTLIQGQLAQAGQQAAGAAAGTLANGVTRGLSNGLGTQGTQVLGVAAAAIANPQAALATIENMALKFATGAATATVNALAAQGGDYLSKVVGGYTNQLNHTLSYSDTAGGTLTGDLVNSGKGIATSVQTFFTPPPPITQAQLADDALSSETPAMVINKDIIPNEALQFNDWNTLTTTVDPNSIDYSQYT